MVNREALLKNAAVIAFLLSKAGNLVKTKLVKLAFLGDVEAQKELGRKITHFCYSKYLYGPYPQDIETVLTYLEAKGYIEYEEGINREGNTYYLISLQENPGSARLINRFLQNKEKEILNKIVKEYGDLSLQTLLQHIYDMEDVKQAEFAKVIL
jgi:uncharacterized protein YwgA